jgi:hypothetical protein
MGRKATKATTDMMIKYLAEFIAFLPWVRYCNSLLPVFSPPEYFNASDPERLTMKRDFLTMGSR